MAPLTLTPAPVPNGVYRILPSDDNLKDYCIELFPDNNTIKLAQIDENRPQQQWRVESTFEGLYVLPNVNSPKVVFACNTGGKNAFKAVPVGTDNYTTVWTIDALTDEFIIGVPNDADVVDVATKPTPPPLILSARDGDRSQHWTLDIISLDNVTIWEAADAAIPAGDYNLTNKSTARLWNVPGTVSYYGDTVLTSSLAPSYKIFTITKDSDGRIRLSNNSLVAGTSTTVTRYVNPGAALRFVQNSCRLIPVKNETGYYFISGDLATNPPRVITDTRSPAGDGSGNAYLTTDVLDQDDDRQKWLLSGV